MACPSWALEPGHTLIACGHVGDRKLVDQAHRFPSTRSIPSSTPADMAVRLSSPQPPKARRSGPFSWPRRRRSAWCATRGQAGIRGLATAGPVFVKAPAV